MRRQVDDKEEGRSGKNKNNEGICPYEVPCGYLDSRLLYLDYCI